MVVDLRVLGWPQKNKMFKLDNLVWIIVMMNVQRWTESRDSENRHTSFQLYLEKLSFLLAHTFFLLTTSTLGNTISMWVGCKN